MIVSNERIARLVATCPVPKARWRPGAVVDYGLWWIDRRGRVIVEPHRGQQRALFSRRRIRIVVAGSQGGKTSLGPWIMYREILRRGPGTYLAVTTTYSLFKNAMLPSMRTVFEWVLGIARYWRGAQMIEIADPQTGKFYAENPDDHMWARIILRTASSESGLEAATAKGVWMDEFGMDEWGIEAWEAIRARVTTTGGFIFGTTTPYNEGWVKTDLYERWLNGDPEIDWINFPSDLNPMFPREEIERARETMSEWRFRMRYLGEFASPPSVVYRLPEDFFVEPFDVPTSWPVVVGVDFGGANTARVALAQDPASGIWYIFHEWLGGNMTTREHVAAAKRDYASFARFEVAGGSAGETQNRRDWTDAGLRVHQPLSLDVETGIERVQSVIKSGKLRCFSDLRGIRHEFSTYKRKTLPDGTVLDQIENKPMFHRLDALRYAVLHIVARENMISVVF